MKILRLIPIIILLSCQKSKPIHETKIHKVDTIIGSKIINDETVYSTDILRVKSYFVIVKNDTSNFKPIFKESFNDKLVSINLNFNYNIQDTYKNRMVEFDKILKKASQDYNLDSLRGIHVGELIQTGDLAVQITKDFKMKFGNEIKEEKNSAFISDYNYDKIVEFLHKSKLTSDFNLHLKPYKISVDTIYIEKAHFASKLDLLNFSKIEIDTSLIPDQILDCTLRLRLKKNK